MADSEQELLMLQQAAILEKQKEEELYIKQQQAIHYHIEEEKRKDDELYRLQHEALYEHRRDEVMMQGNPSMHPPGIPHVPGTHGQPPMNMHSMPPPGMGVLPPGMPPNLHPPGELHTDTEDSLLMKGMIGDLRDLRLPQALEQALQFKVERARQLGVKPEDMEKVESEGLPDQSLIHSSQYEVDDDDEEEAKENKNDKSKSMKKKKKKKKKRSNVRAAPIKPEKEKTKTDEKEEEKVEVEYVQEQVVLDPVDPMFKYFARVFDAFKINERDSDGNIRETYRMLRPDPDLKKVPKLIEDELLEERKEEDKPKLSKRKMKKLTRLTVAELKQLVARPDVVEMHDVTARDPKLLVLLKATRNTVAVPRHWCFKRKYLQGKRGIEKPPFMLPDFIRKTGIMEMRQALQDKEDQKTMKAKMRERVRPKMGKIDIDYQKLHDAFFKWQTKPRMTIHGDLYYEGKEFETRLKEKKPGELSDELKTALGMPVGLHSHKVPPPWLIAMQRYGPPPSYPNLKIPGLNAPIPDGCSFGYHAGGWGKPPVDELGRPLYGDVFGASGTDYTSHPVDEDIDRSLWGELESESEESSEEEEEEEEQEIIDIPVDQTGLVTPAEGGLVTPSGIASIPAGLETPELIELRKKKIESEMEGTETPALFTVLPEKKASDHVSRGMMGSTYTYDMSQIKAVSGGGMFRNQEAQGVEVALDPSELDLMDTEAMAARYEQTVREQQSHLAKEDLSDMVAEHVAKQKTKRKRQQQQQDTKQAKKYKEFKF